MTKRSETSKYARALKKLVYAKYPYMLGHSCGFPAFYLKKLPQDDAPIQPHDVIYPDGRTPEIDEVAICFKCKKELTGEDFQEHNIRRIQ